MLTIKACKTFGVVTKGNSKIHGSTFSTDPSRCHVGSRMVNIKGSTCSNCYALKLANVYPSAQKSWSNNLDLFRHAVASDTVPDWCVAIAHQINAISRNKINKGIKGGNFHRWFTAGDLDSVDMLRAFVRVAELLPNINFWLPTREKGIVSRYRAALGTVPSNMVIRLSSAMIDSVPLVNMGNTSTTHKTKGAIGYNCPAQNQGGNCGDCSACWSIDVKNVSYAMH